MTRNWTIPIAILFAAIIIGAAFFFSRPPAAPSVTAPNPGTASPAKTKNVPAVNAADHIMGNANAPVKIVEYTDFECQNCKQFDETMKQVLAEYPGQVAWVIRNFPLAELHPHAPQLALAGECAAELGGNNGYFSFKDAVFGAAPANTPCIQTGNGCAFFDMSQLTATAQLAGLDGKAFDSCVASGKYVELVTAQFNDAVADGAEGAPFNVLMAAGTQVAIPGAQSFDSLKQVIDVALKNS